MESGCGKPRGSLVSNPTVWVNTVRVMSFISGKRPQRRKRSQNVPCLWLPVSARTGQAWSYIQVAACECSPAEAVFRRVVTLTPSLSDRLSQGNQGASWETNQVGWLQQFCLLAPHVTTGSQGFRGIHWLKVTTNPRGERTEAHRGRPRCVPLTGSAQFRSRRLTQPPACPPRTSRQAPLRLGSLHHHSRLSCA